MRTRRLNDPVSDRAGDRADRGGLIFRLFGPPNRHELKARLPEAGERVRMEHAASDAVYFANVREITPRSLVLAIEGEFELADVANLVDGTSITVSYDRGEALYRFQSLAVSIHGALIAVAKPREVLRVQRRDYYRLPLQSPVTYRLLSQGAPPSLTAAGRLVNLSGGGALLATSRPVAAGTRAVLRVPSGKDGTPVDVVAESLDCRSAIQGRSTAFLVRFRFSGPPLLETEDRDAIVAYIFEQQRIMLRTRKLLQ